MKDSYPSVSLVRLCRFLGVTRQAFYQFFWQAQEWRTEEELIVEQVKELRTHHPVMGGRKLYCLLQPFLLEHQIKLGRDALFDLLATHKLLVRKKRRTIRTTNSYHWFKKYPNLIKQWAPELPNQLWVADITYLPVTGHFLYISLITDAYSHKIMGYHVGETLEAVHTTAALKMALTAHVPSHTLIHHSDRGIQYCSAEYVQVLTENKIEISMTQSGDPLENPIAERVNGIVKNEYLKHEHITDAHTAMVLLQKTVTKYNEQRPHHSIQLLTPALVHGEKLQVNRRWGKTTTFMKL
ncbi:MAG: IS3 family transposase [Chitinophagaceae bacterium]|nr:IS3 family transposase [Chitinophagaceae bacterium]